MYKCCFLVLLYNKEFNDSDTLDKLYKSNHDFKNCMLVIWNNGPNSLSKNVIDLNRFKDKGFDIELIESIKNESLAKIYNKFISFYESETFIILDDDTSLNDKYISALKEIKNDQIGIPVVKYNNKVESPILDGKVYSKLGSINEGENISSIGSGLVLGRAAIKNILNYFDELFDERFYLYGVDTNFFRRINKIGILNNIVVINGFNHSLSRLEFESKKTKKFRLKERTFDLVLSCRYYYKEKYYLRMTKLMLTVIYRMIFLKPQIVDPTAFVYALMLGKHYRFSEDKEIIRYRINS